MSANDTIRKALKCVCTRLRVMSKDGLKEPQKRWLGHTIDIAENALAGTNDAAYKAQGRVPISADCRVVGVRWLGYAR